MSERDTWTPVFEQLGRCAEGAVHLVLPSEETRSVQFGTMLLPSMSLFIPYQVQKYYTRLRLARGMQHMCTIHECVLCYIQDSNIAEE